MRQGFLKKRAAITEKNQTTGKGDGLPDRVLRGQLPKAMVKLKRLDHRVRSSAQAAVTKQNMNEGA